MSRWLQALALLIQLALWPRDAQAAITAVYLDASRGNGAALSRGDSRYSFQHRRCFTESYRGAESVGKFSVESGSGRRSDRHGDLPAERGDVGVAVAPRPLRACCDRQPTRAQ